MCVNWALKLGNTDENHFIQNALLQANMNNEAFLLFIVSQVKLQG